jgi:Ca-activated chloride channel family protein
VSFASPWLLLLLPLAATFLLLRVAMQPRRPRLAIADLDTLRAAARPSWRLRLRWLPWVLRAAAIALLIVAVARPQRGLALTTLPEDGIDVVVALDVSGSMGQLAEPGLGSPSKLAAAQEVIEEFVDSLEGDRVGLVTFQSRALLLSPLTLDHVALQRQVDAVESGLIVDGTAIGLGLAEALNLLRDSPARSRVVVLLTDGENNQGEVPPLQAARVAETLDVRVYTIGFHGASRAGSQVDVRLLQQIASTTGAEYFDASTQAELSDAYGAVSELERSRVGERRFTEFEEYGPALAVVALLLLVAEAALRATAFRRYP